MIGTPAQDPFVRSPRPRRDAEQQRPVHGGHFPNVIGNAIGQHNRLARAHGRLGDHLVRGHGIAVAWKVSVNVDFHLEAFSGEIGLHNGGAILLRSVMTAPAGQANLG